MTRAAFKRFVQLPYFLHRLEPRWAPPLIAYERWRLDTARNPFFDRGDAAWFLVRRVGKPAGRITAHVRHEGDEGWFGFFDVADDARSAAALVEAAQAWLRERGCISMTGPVSFTEAEEAGVLVAGFESPGVTGRQWHPPWYSAHLEAAGLEPAEERPTWRLDARGDRTLKASDDVGAPAVGGSYCDPDLLLAGAAGSVAAVPDIAGPLRDSGIRSAWQLARRARQREWDGCTVVRVDGDPGVLVPAVCAAAGGGSYQWVVAPWAPDDRPPEAVHRLFRKTL